MPSPVNDQRSRAYAPQTYSGKRSSAVNDCGGVRQLPPCPSQRAGPTRVPNSSSRVQICCPLARRVSKVRRPEPSVLTTPAIGSAAAQRGSQRAVADGCQGRTNRTEDGHPRRDFVRALEWSWSSDRECSRRNGALAATVAVGWCQRRRAAELRLQESPRPRDCLRRKQRLDVSPRRR